MKKHADIRMVPDGSSMTSCDSTVDVDLESIPSSEKGSIDSVADVGKSCQELTKPTENKRYETHNFNCFL